VIKPPDEVIEPVEGSRGEYPGAFKRLRLAVGNEGLDRLNSARVAVIGLGAVGSFATEALARSGIGYLRLVDFDRIRLSIHWRISILDQSFPRLHYFFISKKATKPGM